MIIVSHEMAFVREVSSKVVFMADGKVVEMGPPSQIFDNPQTERCARVCPPHSQTLRQA